MILRKSLWELEKRYCVLLFDINTTQLITIHLLLHDDHSIVLVQVRLYEITCCLVKVGGSTLHVLSSVNQVQICRTWECVFPENIALVSKLSMSVSYLLQWFSLISQVAKLYCKILIRKNTILYIYIYICMSLPSNYQGQVTEG